MNVGSKAMVSVDGKPIKKLQNQATAKGLAGGNHVVAVHNQAGQLITQINVEVAHTEQVRLQFRKKVLTETGRGRLAPEAATGNPGLSIQLQAGLPRPQVALANLERGTMPMAPELFQSLRHQVEEASFSKDRLALIETAAKNNRFTCHQAAELLKAMSFDNKRVDGAKMIVPHRIVDPENAHVLAEAFDFSSNAREVQELF